MIPVSERIVILYTFSWIVRLWGCVRRGRQPLVRGREWFFDVPVEPGFYDGAGKRLLRRYRLRMLVPFAIDIPFAIAIFRSGHLTLLLWLVIGVSVFIHLNHVFSVDLAERQARPFAVPGSGQPVSRIAVSLQSRRLRDYANPRIEWTIALLSIGTIAWLIRYYLAAPDRYDLRFVLGAPLLVLYMQAGLLVVKRAVLAWRRAVPQDHAAEYLAVVEQTRRVYLLICDCYRLTMTLSLVWWPVRLSMSAQGADLMEAIWFGASMAVAAGTTVWIEIKRRQLVDLSVRARPATLPDFLHQSEIPRWPVCYEPSTPMLMLNGAQGRSLNLANSLAQLSAAYLAGFAVLIFAIRHL